LRRRRLGGLANSDGGGGSSLNRNDNSQEYFYSGNHILFRQLRREIKESEEMNSLAEVEKEAADPNIKWLTQDVIGFDVCLGKRPVPFS
jgi:hypothetical protein